MDTINFKTAFELAQQIKSLDNDRAAELVIYIYKAGIEHAENWWLDQDLDEDWIAQFD